MFFGGRRRSEAAGPCCAGAALGCPVAALPQVVARQRRGTCCCSRGACRPRRQALWRLRFQRLQQAQAPPPQRKQRAYVCVQIGGVYPQSARPSAPASDPAQRSALSGQPACASPPAPTARCAHGCRRPPQDVVGGRGGADQRLHHQHRRQLCRRTRCPAAACCPPLPAPARPCPPLPPLPRAPRACMPRISSGPPGRRAGWVRGLAGWQAPRAGRRHAVRPHEHDVRRLEHHGQLRLAALLPLQAAGGGHGGCRGGGKAARAVRHVPGDPPAAAGLARGLASRRPLDWAWLPGGHCQPAPPLPVAAAGIGAAAGAGAARAVPRPPALLCAWPASASASHRGPSGPGRR
jgi:hypothetical protein